jgi:hypothetical protein
MYGWDILLPRFGVDLWTLWESAEVVKRFLPFFDRDTLKTGDVLYSKG